MLRNILSSVLFCVLSLSVQAAESQDLSSPRADQSTQAGMPMAKIKERPHKENFNMTPPKIYVTHQPTALISIDGAPVLRAIKDTNLMRVINTPFVILFDSKNSQYYLRAGSTWQTTNDLMAKWRIADTVPKDVKKVQSQLKDANQGETGINNIIVSTEPASLIEVNGEANYVPITGTDLLYVQNSDSKVILQTNTQRYFALISGRWYSANALTSTADWTYVPGNELPKSFSNIPKGLPISDVLASVPGTAEAKEAIARNQIPTTKKFEKKSLKLRVKYDGAPKFAKIKGTDLESIRNANKPVIRYKNRYFANDNAVWFVADSLQGPWLVADSIPDEFYDIPPESPFYRLTYCYIYDATEDFITIGCTPGYEGSYVYNGAVIYGTGYYYDPWIGDDYYGYPYTYGFDYGYDPSYGWYSPAPYYWFGGAAFGSVVGHSFWHRSGHAHRDHRDHRHRGRWNNARAFQERNKLERFNTRNAAHVPGHHQQRQTSRQFNDENYRHQGGKKRGDHQTRRGQQQRHHLNRHEQVRARSQHQRQQQREQRSRVVPRQLEPSHFGGIDRGQRAGGGFDRGRRAGGGFERGPRAGGGFDRGPRAGGGFERGPRPGGGFDRGPRPSGGFERGPRPGGGFDRGPRAGGGFDRGPRAGGGIDRAPRAGGGFDRGRGGGGGHGGGRGRH